MTMKKKDFEHVYDMFGSNIAKKYDCGRFCAPLNGGSPVCCSTEHAVPVVDKVEWKLLKTRTDIWSEFKPYDKATHEIVDELPDTCMAIECKGAKFCERDNRSIACRAFPFFPYFTKEEKLVGVSYYWIFEDRCWVISNMQVVEKKFVKELIRAYEYIFERDEDEREAFLDQSKSMRRTFSRRNKPIPLIGRDGGYFKVLPKTRGKIVPAKLSDLVAHGPYVSDKAYRKAIKEAGGKAKGQTLSDPPPYE